MRTEDLIDQLARETGPVRPLLGPWWRTGMWLTVAAAFVTLVVLMMSPRPDLAEVSRNPRFWIEQGAALATTVLAARAALALSIPGTTRRVALAPLAPALLWLGSQGVGCLADLTSRTGARLVAEPECLAFIALTGSVPALALVAMLRRGLPVRPRLSLALAALAAAAIGNVGLRFFHAQDAALMVLVWQTGSVALLSLAGGVLGRTLLARRIDS